MPSKPKKPKADETLDWLDSNDTIDLIDETWPEETSSAEDTWDERSEPDNVQEPMLPQEELDDTDIDLPPLVPTHTPVVVGHKETVSLPDHGIQQLHARFSTDSERSTLHGNVRQVVANHVTLELGKTIVELPAFEDKDILYVALNVDLDGMLFQGNLQIVATSGPPFLILGRDLIAGRVIVDPSGAWVKSKR